MMAKIAEVIIPTCTDIIIVESHTLHPVLRIVQHTQMGTTHHLALPCDAVRPFVLALLQMPCVQESVAIGEVAGFVEHDHGC